MPKAAEIDPLWSAQSLRLSLFPAESGDFSAVEWKDVTSQEPDIDEKRPREVARRQIGGFGNGLLELQTSALRADLLYMPRAPEGVPDPSKIVLGPFDQELKTFMLTVEPWLSRLPIPVVRIALGAVLLAPADEMEGTYAILRKYLRSVQVDQKHMSEFLYRVNWKVPTRFANLDYINRLGTWSALKAMVKAATAGSELSHLIASTHFAQFEIDINSPLENLTPIAPDELAKLLGQIRDLALENARIGEVINVPD